MARQFFINGESLCYVKFGAHIPTSVGNIPGIPVPSNRCELGLTSDQIVLTPKIVRHDVKTDDLGPEIPANLMQYMSEMNITMTLVHFDQNVLQIVQGEAGGGAVVAAGGVTDVAPGVLQPAGTFLGFGPVLASGNHFMSLNIASPKAGLPYRFPSCTLADTPMRTPLGTGYSMVTLNWRAIPYSRPNPVTGECFSSGAKLWDRTLDQ